MNQYVALLRAINVGGHTVKMDHLRAMFESAGFSNVSTFIASGNVIFDSPKTAAQAEVRIEKTLQKELGYGVITMVRTRGEIASIVAHVNHRKLQATDVTLYVGFSKAAPDAAAANAVAALSNDTDILAVDGRELYWQCRAKSFTDSTIKGNVIEKTLKVPTTLRNFTTVSKIAAKYS